MKKFNSALTKPFYLQLFADDGSGQQGGDPQGGEPQGGNPQGGQEPQGGPSPDPKGTKSSTPKYTDEDVDRIIDRKFSAWMKKQEKAQKEKDEAARLQSMSDEEKREHQYQEMQKELNRLKNEKALGDMARTARGLLSERNINVGDELINNLISTDAEETKKAVDSFANAFEKAVQDAVAEKLKGKAPVAGQSGKKITKEEIMNVKNARERQKLITEHMDLFK